MKDDVADAAAERIEKFPVWQVHFLWLLFLFQRPAPIAARLRWLPMLLDYGQLLDMLVCSALGWRSTLAQLDSSPLCSPRPLKSYHYFPLGLRAGSLPPVSAAVVFSLLTRSTMQGAGSRPQARSKFRVGDRQKQCSFAIFTRVRARSLAFQWFRQLASGEPTGWMPVAS